MSGLQGLDGCHFHGSSSSNFCDVQSAQMALKSCDWRAYSKTYCEKVYILSI